VVLSLDLGVSVEEVRQLLNCPVVCLLGTRVCSTRVDVVTEGIQLDRRETFVRTEEEEWSFTVLYGFFSSSALLDLKDRSWLIRIVSCVSQ
jgi:hypothetical protein